MSALINIASFKEWDSLLASTSVVVADFYADWCGPCRAIAPIFERLSKEHASPRKVTFAKVDVDRQSDVARAQSVSAMPTFKIFHNGRYVDTIQGANPAALSNAVSRAVKLADAGGQPGAPYKTPGRTLGAGTPATARRGGGSFGGSGSWTLNGLVQAVISFVGLYIVSLFSTDARKAAESSMFNVHRRPPVQKKPSSTSASTGTSSGYARPPQKPAFRTLADLGSG